jgi:hypothetical protein
MRRFLRIRILFVLIALLLVPALVLAFAERLRTEWARYWAPKPIIDATTSLDELSSAERAVLAERTLRAMERLRIDLHSVPFPDEPPIFYKDAAYWERLEASKKDLGSPDNPG